MNKTIVLLIVTVLPSTFCLAQSTWTGGGGGNTSWSNAANWDDGGVPNGNAVNVDDFGSSVSITGVSGTVASLYSNQGNFSLTLSGAGLTLDSIDIISGEFTAHLPITFTSGGFFNHQATQNATFTQQVTIADGDTFNVSTGLLNPAGTIAFSAGLAGDGLLDIRTARVLLSSSSSHTGGTQVLGSGVLSITNTTGSATGSGEVIIGESSQIQGNGTISGNLTFNTGGEFNANLINVAGSHVPLKVLGSLSLDTTPVNITSNGGSPSAGTYTLIQAGSITGNATLGSVSLPEGVFASTPQVVGNNLVVAITGGGYSSWASGANATADANNDGITNLMAYALGAGNTTVSARSLLPVLTGTPGNYTFSANATQRPDLTYEVQLSTSSSLNATVWTNASGTATTGGVVARKTLGGAWTEIMGGEPNGITVNATASGVQVIDTNNTSRRFWRLSVSSGNITVTR
ncbi:MAG: hypothetical protein SFU85_13715 [Candidatus Methylacidiphilales bacterium]|nr:hypothetical protein [Candidatus Methylacidiphilales bacterium]